MLCLRQYANIIPRNTFVVQAYSTLATKTVTRYNKNKIFSVTMCWPLVVY